MTCAGSSRARARPALSHSRNLPLTFEHSHRCQQVPPASGAHIWQSLVTHTSSQEPRARTSWIGRSLIQPLNPTGSVVTRWTACALRRSLAGRQLRCGASAQHMCRSSAFPAIALLTPPLGCGPVSCHLVLVLSTEAEMLQTPACTMCAEIYNFSNCLTGNQLQAYGSICRALLAGLLQATAGGDGCAEGRVLRE